jgi:hypothetical protein
MALAAIQIKQNKLMLIRPRSGRVSLFCFLVLFKPTSFPVKNYTNSQKCDYTFVN